MIIKCPFKGNTQFRYAVTNCPLERYNRERKRQRKVKATFSFYFIHLIDIYFYSKGKQNNFLKYEHGKLDKLGLPYDYVSIMHYDRYLYSVDGKKPTIIARGKPWKRLGGQLRGTLTVNDIKEIRALYNC